jgi:hypothetical protein
MSKGSNFFCARCGMSRRNDIHKKETRPDFHKFADKEQNSEETIMSTELHIANIEREAEVLKNVVRDLCTQNYLLIKTLNYHNDPVHALDDLAKQFLELREDVDRIFPRK